MKRDTVPETCHPYGVQKESGAASHILQTCRSYGAKSPSICHVSKRFRSTDIFTIRFRDLPNVCKKIFGCHETFEIIWTYMIIKKEK